MVACVHELMQVRGANVGIVQTLDGVEALLVGADPEDVGKGGAVGLARRRGPATGPRRAGLLRRRQARNLAGKGGQTEKIASIHGWLPIGKTTLTRIQRRRGRIAVILAGGGARCSPGRAADSPATARRRGLRRSGGSAPGRCPLPPGLVVKNGTKRLAVLERPGPSSLTQISSMRVALPADGHAAVGGRARHRRRCAGG